MLKKTIGVLLILSNTLFAQGQQNFVRKKVNFDQGWKFHLGNAADPKKDFNYGIANIFSKEGSAGNTCISPDFNDSGWANIHIPHDWLVRLPFVDSPDPNIMAHGYKPIGGLFPDNSIGWYRKTFNLPAADSGLAFSITFDGVYRNCQVWLNGNFVGANRSGYIGRTFDISNALHFKKKNVLVVRVDATQFEGWFYEGAGIYRHVWLNEYHPVHIPTNGIFVYSQVLGKQARISVATSLKNGQFHPVRCEVLNEITDREGRVIARGTPIRVMLPADGTQKLKQEISLSSPRLWTLTDPYLYRIVTRIMLGNTLVDQKKIRFGIRTITIDAHRGLLLNGHPVKIQGVCCHQDHAGVGVALPDYLQYYRIRLLKAMGANAYRTTHNPPSPVLLDACDSLGMLVLDENRLLNSSPEYLDQFERMIRRDRNHPSIFLWSIGNEEGWVQTTAIGKKIARTLIQKQKELDPTRTCTYAADLANVYQGINEVIPVRGFNYRIQGIDAYHHDHPDQPIIGTEMGSTVTDRGEYQLDSIHGYVPDEDITHPWWATTAEQWWKIAATRPWFMGGFVWTGFDYRGEPTPFSWPNISSHFGVMDVCGFPKNIYYYYQSWWTHKNVLHISPHWNWKGKEGQPISVWVNSNADQIELFLNGKSWGKKRMPRNGHLVWKVNYQPGILKAIAEKNGETFSAQVETTGNPFAIVLQPDRTLLQADGEDATVINVVVKDKEGRMVPDADNLIHFTLKGDGRMIGVGNGDPSSHEPDQFPHGNDERHLFNGKCQLIVQAGKQGGEISVVAQSTGLKQAGCLIQTQLKN
ncbi:MAG: beta-galactosidase GalA [Chitinophagaceae bacterium]